MKKLKPPKKNAIARSRDRWYEVVEYFDPTGIQKLPMKDGRAFILGDVQGITIVEVSKDTTRETVDKLGEWLRVQGIEALVMYEGMRFMKLRALSPAEEKFMARQLRKVDLRECTCGPTLQAIGEHVSGCPMEAKHDAKEPEVVGQPETDGGTEAHPTLGEHADDSGADGHRD